MEILRTVIAVVLLLLAAYIAVMNWCCVIVSLRNQKKGIDKNHSQVFIFHNFLPVAAFFIYPHSPKWWIWLIPALDMSNLTLLAWPFLLLKEKKNQGSNNDTQPSK